LEFDARNFYEENCDKEPYPPVEKKKLENPEEEVQKKEFKLKVHPIGPSKTKISEPVK
jgi:hypothetical protein